MTEYRPATREERIELGEIFEKLKVKEAENVVRFIDSRWNKLYDVYLAECAGQKYLLKQVKGRRREKENYETYFSGKDFAVPRLYDTFDLDEASWLLYEFADGPDAVNCCPADAEKIGEALANIQSCYLCEGGHTEAAESYFSRYLAEEVQKARQYFEGREDLWAMAEKRFFEAPQTLVHDDLLPINVLLSGSGPRIIDWETAGILPYFLDLGRFAYVVSDSVGPLLSPESADAFLASYHKRMAEDPAFSIDSSTFRRDVLISTLFQYLQFLDYDKPETELRATRDFQILEKVLMALKDHKE